MITETDAPPDRVGEADRPSRAISPAVLAQELRNAYGYKSYDMVRVEGSPDHDPTYEPGPIQYSFKFHPLIARVIAMLEGTQGASKASAKAVEFGEYLAKGAEQLLDALSAEDEQELALDEIDSDDLAFAQAEQQLERAIEARDDMARALRGEVYEFRKRAAKYAAFAAPIAKGPAT